MCDFLKQNIMLFDCKIFDFQVCRIDRVDSDLIQDRYIYCKFM